jgi:pyridoxal phosphate enzyme (YggS family)
MIESQTIADNLKAAHARIAAAARECNRDPGSIALIAVSKIQPMEAIAAALQSGHRLFGENRVQEAAAKFPKLRAQWPELRLHLIGPLQTNKVRQALDIADAIETLDRDKLARALADEVQRRGKACDLFIQVNTGEEPQKAGVAPLQADGFIERCRGEFNLPVRGLMCIPPAGEHPAPHFALLREIAKRNGLSDLSMGMSGDFETAIQFGATFIRIGSAIFGQRPAN